MKLATINDGSADGRLVVVARDLEHVAVANGIARTLQEALERWDEVLTPLGEVYDHLNSGTAARTVARSAVRFMAPLPRAWTCASVSGTPSQAPETSPDLFS